MPRQDASDIHVDEELSDLAIVDWQGAENYAALRFFPVVSSGKESDLYRIWNRYDLLRLRAKKRVDGEEAASNSIGSTTERFFCEAYAFKDRITYRDRANDSGPIPIREVRTKSVVQAHLTNLELDFLDKFVTTGKWTHNYLGVASLSPAANQFSAFDFTDADPVKEMIRLARVIQSTTGKRPNILGFGGDVIDSLQINPAILERIKYNGGNGNPAEVTMQALAAMFKVDEVVEMQAVQTTTKEGDTTQTVASIFSKVGLMAYRAPAPSKDVPSAGYTFAWNEPEGASDPRDINVYEYDTPAKRIVEIEAEMYLDQKITSADLGMFLGDVIG